ncbi:carbon storage regulator CsrA [Brachyspira sp. G79]|uniref:carbon storage regulator CsrA n=3 Tax=Brachyspira TaxID=29521 RepID=UPI000BBC35B1|nr:carbon storage regulator CsrA [Brachyspira sp. G79]PCG19770.1 carbon storage regulator [Brachyspira sp. G79]
MLVLSRKINQSIVIGDNIEIMLVDIRGDQIKLGINAPKNVKIFRKEVYEEIESQNLEASKEATADKLNILSNFVKNKFGNNNKK